MNLSPKEQMIQNATIAKQKALGLEPSGFVAPEKPKGQGLKDALAVIGPSLAGFAVGGPIGALAGLGSGLESVSHPKEIGSEYPKLSSLGSSYADYMSMGGSGSIDDYLSKTHPVGGGSSDGGMSLGELTSFIEILNKLGSGGAQEKPSNVVDLGGTAGLNYTNGE